jgi:plastocyanin
VKLVYGPMLGALIGVACLWLPPLGGIHSEASAHGTHEHFAAGEPGDPKKPFRIVRVTMLEDGKKMLFEPAVVDVRLGEQVRFEIFN